MSHWYVSYEVLYSPDDIVNLKVHGVSYILVYIMDINRVLDISICLHFYLVKLPVIPRFFLLINYNFIGNEYARNIVASGDAIFLCVKISY